MLQPCDRTLRDRRYCRGRPPPTSLWDGRSMHAPLEAIEQAVVQVFGVGPEDLRCMTRGRANVALARQVAMYLAHVVCGMTLTDTGRLFGRDRTTVAHACGVIEDRRDDPLFDRALDLLGWVVPAITCRFPPAPHLSS
jgi:hypothetical protein